LVYRAATTTALLTVNKIDATILLPTTINKILADIQFTIAATTNSTGAITYTSSDATVASIDGNTVSLLKLGTATITATQAADNNYNAATTTTSLVIGGKTETVMSLDAINKSYGDATFTVAAISNSDGVITYTSSDETVAKISGTTVTIIGVGTATITATQVSTSAFTAASTTAVLTVSSKAPIISLSAIYKTYGDSSFSIAATSTSDGAITYTSSDATVVTISGTTVTIVGAGTATITATQAAAGGYDAATATATITVSKADQIITIGSLPTSAPLKDLNNVQITANASSGLPVVISLGDGSAATLNGSNQLVSIGSTGTVTIVVTQAGNANYNAASFSQSLDVTKNNQTISFGSLTAVTYQPGLTSTLGAFASSGLDISYTVISGPGNIDGNILTITGAGTITISASQAGDAANNEAAAVSQTLVVNKAALTISLADITKNYGAANFDLSLTTASTGVINYTSSNELVATIANKTVSILSTGTTTITATQVSDDNYLSATTTALLRVNKIAATISLPSSISKNIAEQSFTIAATSNATGTITYTSSDETIASIVGTTVTLLKTGSVLITASQVADNNYNSATATATLVIGGTIKTVISMDAITKTYGDASFTIAATSTSAAAITYISSDATVATISGSTVTIVGAGTATITATQDASGGFSAATTTALLTISKATLSVTADNKTKVYGSANPALTVTYSGFKGTDAATSLSTVPTASTTATTTSGVGTYGITASGGISSNYDFVYVSGTLTITKATLTVTADNKTKVYGAANPALTVTYSGFKGTDAATSLSTVPTASTTATTTSGVGTYAITASGGGSSNYDFIYVAGTLTITKATLTVTAEDKTKVYGAANPALTVSYSGFTGGDAASSLGTAPTASTIATTTSGVGTYAITASGGVSSNYDFIYVAGTLTITKATLSVTADNKTKVYGSANPALTVSYTGFVSTDNATSLSAAPTATTTATTASVVGTYGITASGGVSDNYDFTYTAGTLTVTKATLTITAQDASRCFGSTDPTLSYLVTGYVNGDDATAIVTKPTVVTNATVSSVAGDYKTIVSAAVALNYNFVYVDGKFTVNPLPVGTVSSAVDYVCDGATLTLNVTGGDSYLWYKAGVVIPNATGSSIVINSNGIYNAKLISSFGCEAMSANKLTIKQYYAPKVDFSTQFFCIDKPVYLSNESIINMSGMVKYLWSDGAGGTSTAANPTFTYASTGNKTIQLTVTPDYCPALKQSISKTVAIESPAAAVRMPIKDVIASEPTMLEARSFGSGYEWTPTGIFIRNDRTAHPTVTVNEQTLFHIKITVPSSCVTEDTLLVRVFKERTVFLPNVFTPNGDGVNDVFRINPVGIKMIRYFRIFNQWGHKVFETNILNEGWDGKFKGILEPLATYTWLIDGMDDNGKIIQKTGSVTLLR
jgi:gliding motility-associated-like protein